MGALDNKWLVSVSAGAPQLSSIQAAQTAGVHVFALDGNPKAPGLAIADHHQVVDIKEPGAVVDAVKASGIVPQGVISFVSDVGMQSAACLREYFGLPGPNLSQSEALTNKLVQRSIWQDHNVPNPDWIPAHSLQDAREGVKEIGFPAIVKPADSSGSRGVSKIESHTPLDQALTTAFEFSRTGSIIIESFIEGQEFSVETFSENGRTHVLTISERILINDTTASEIVTADLESTEYEAIVTTTQQAFEALQYTDGPGHTEIMLCPNDQTKLIETAGRGGGFHIFDRMIYLVSGYDIVSATIFQALGMEIKQIPDAIEERYAILHYIPSYSGCVQKISGFKSANRLTGVEAQPLVSIGEKVRNPQCDEDKLGYILTVADTISTARLRTSQALDLIEFQLDPN